MTDPNATTLERVRRDFPAWHITYDPDAPAWCQWVARRRRPLALVEIRHQRRAHVYGPTHHQLLADLGAEQRAQDILEAVTRV